MNIGILNKTLAWDQLASQLNISFSNYNPLIVSDKKYSLIIVNRECSQDELNILKKVYKEGTNILEIKNYFSKTNIYSQFVNSINPKIFNIPTFSQMLDFNSKLYFYSNNSPFKIEKTKTSTLFQLGIEIDNFLLNNNSTRKNFYSGESTFPNEVVSDNSKYFLRHIFNYILCKSNSEYSSKIKEPIFTFRIDTDKGSETQMFKLYDLLNKHSIKGTWFLDVKSHLNFLDKLQQFKNQEFGLHCFDHSHFTNYDSRINDIHQALSILNSNGIKVKGTTSPFGQWNEELNSIYEYFNFSYSSEFLIDYDNVPYFPVVNGKFSKVMQIPIHPICIGSLLAAGFSKNKMIKYFENVILQKYFMNEPICIYHHPTHEQHEVLETIFELVTKLQLPKLTFFEYSQLFKNGKLNFGTDSNYKSSYPNNLQESRNFSLRTKLNELLYSFYKLS